MTFDDRFIQPTTRRRLLRQLGTTGAILASGPVWADTVTSLPLPGGPTRRQLTTEFPQKRAMILQRTRAPLLETPFEVFDRGVFTPNDQFYVRWHWAVIPTEVRVDTFRLSVSGHVNSVFHDILTIVSDDGVEFDAEGLRVSLIREELEYGGLRLRGAVSIAGARIAVVVDIGFGDSVEPRLETIGYPVLLDLPAPRLRAYALETVIAEKFQAMVALGRANSSASRVPAATAGGRRRPCGPS